MGLFLTNFFFVVVLIDLLIALLFAIAAFVARLKKKRQEALPKHDHDCLVEQCDFHGDAEVDEMMRRWLQHNKLRGVVLDKHTFKEFALNLFIAEVTSRRPLSGETTWDDK